MNYITLHCRLVFCRLVCMLIIHVTVRSASVLASTHCPWLTTSPLGSKSEALTFQSIPVLGSDTSRHFSPWSNHRYEHSSYIPSPQCTGCQHHPEHETSVSVLLTPTTAVSVWRHTETQIPDMLIISVDRVHKSKTTITSLNWTSADEIYIVKYSHNNQPLHNYLTLLLKNFQ